jgi:hypothetical protein
MRAYKTYKWLLSMLVLVFSCALQAEEQSTARNQYQWMKQLNGAWVLSPAEQQEGKTTANKVVAPLVGTDKVAMIFKPTGKGSVINETLLPDTKKEMMTMYHCTDADCSQVKATHYCAKKNQPELVVDFSSLETAVVYKCNMDTELCRSNQEHVHQIRHELSNDGQHLKTTYSIYKDGRHLKDSIYHLDRK